jgi:hypothetical protein
VLKIALQHLLSAGEYMRLLYLHLLLIFNLVACNSPIEVKKPDVEFSAAQYITLDHGNMPLLISIPHGGKEMPDQIKDRECHDAEWAQDEFTIELGEAIKTEFLKQGFKPYIVVNKLHRSKLDANRDLAEAACGDPNAVKAWNLFRQYVQESKAEIENSFGKGLYIDLHGHGHQIQRVELGYLLYADELALPPEELNSEKYALNSSLRSLIDNNLNHLTHTELLCGVFSFGSLLQSNGFAAVPSAVIPYPIANEPYFSGGYNIAQYSSFRSGSMDGIQLECNITNLRDTPENRTAFAVAFKNTVIAFLETHYFSQIPLRNH